MMTTVNVVNIKCGGCEKRISEALEKLGATEVAVSPKNQTVSFENGDKEEVLKKLRAMGYPVAGTKAAKSKVKKAQSYASCAVGRWG